MAHLHRRDDPGKLAAWEIEFKRRGCALTRRRIRPQLRWRGLLFSNKSARIDSCSITLSAPEWIPNRPYPDTTLLSGPEDKAPASETRWQIVNRANIGN